MIKQYNFKYRLDAPSQDQELDLKKFTKQLKWGLLFQVGEILMREKDIKFSWDDTGCTATLDFFVDRETKETK